jgi:type IV pilus assembly protein PilQ
MSTKSDHTNLKYAGYTCLLAALLAIALPAPLYAAEATASQAAAPVPAAEQPKPAEQPAVAAHPVSDSDILSVTFQKDASIRDALRYLAAKYQKNIIPSAKVDGALTVSTLYDVTFDQAMKAILGNTFVYETDGSFIRVYAAAEYKAIKEDPGRLQTKVFTLYYISADEAIKLLDPVRSAASSCPECVMKGNTAAEKVAPTGEDISVGSSSGNSNALNDMLVVKDYPEKLTLIEAKLKEIDVRPLQVLVEATILSVKLTENTQFGIDWNTLGGVTITTVADVAANGGGVTTTGMSTLSDTTKSFNIGITSDKITALISAIEQITDTTVLANPKILAINKQLGQVYIGRKLGYRDQTTTGVNGEVISGQVSFLKTGTKLSFRPYIGNDGYIRMDIYPKDSTGVVENGIPNETSAELSTNIMLKDGQTIVIGGLLRTVTTTTKNQVPLLGDLPLIGMAFRSTNDTTEKQEVVVMLTPHIIRTSADTQPDQAKEYINDKMDGARKEIAWYSHTRIAEEHYQNALTAYKNGDVNKAMTEVNAALELRPSYTDALRLQRELMAKKAAKADVSVESAMQQSL